MTAPVKQDRIAGWVGNGGVAVIGLIWYLASTGPMAGILPDPVRVAGSLLQGMQDTAFLGNLAASGLRVLLSLLLALLIGGGLALLPWCYPALNSTVHQVIKPVLNSFPAIAWALLASIWFGVGNFTVIFVQTAILIPFCLVNISEGVRVLDRDLLEMAESFTTRGRRRFAFVVVPLLLPYAIAALRAGWGVAWKIALVAELFGAQTGLGYAMLRAESVADLDRVLAICLVIAMIGMAGDRWLIGPLDRRSAAIRTMS